MYTPKLNRNENTAEITDFIRHHNFGVLISHTGEKFWGTHIPLEISDDASLLHGHIAKANPQWRNFNTNEEVMAIFTGPHAYISSSWYDHENVPTWNYIAVHVYGTIRIIEGDLLYQSLKKLVDKHEKHSAHPVSMETMSPDYVKKSMQGLVGFEIAITNIEASYKLSQNRDAKNYNAIINELEKRNDPGAVQVAEAMKKNTTLTQIKS
jgi:transcriptional regulator